MDASSSIEMSYINNLIEDCPDVIAKLSQSEQMSKDCLEIVSELPSADMPDLIIGMVQRWVDIQKYFDKDLRIYAWTNNPTVEKYASQCVNPMSRVFITVLPYTFRGEEL